MFAEHECRVCLRRSRVVVVLVSLESKQSRPPLATAHRPGGDAYFISPAAVSTKLGAAWRIRSRRFVHLATFMYMFTRILFSGPHVSSLVQFLT